MIEKPMGQRFSINNQKSSINNLLLALEAVVAAAARDYDSLDGRLANQAGLGLAAIDAMLELEESFFAFGVHIVGNGGTAEGDRFFQDLFHCGEKLAQLLARDGLGAAARAQAGAE